MANVSSVLLIFGLLSVLQSVNTDVLQEYELALSPLGAHFLDYFHNESLNWLSNKANLECAMDMAEVTNGISSQKAWALNSTFFYTN